jgi:hypothetical protein
MSFVKVSADSHFPIENLPYGCFRRLHDHSHHSHHSSVGVAIGDQILDLRACVEQKLFKTEELNHLFSHSTLNKFMAAGRKLWTAAREEIKQLLSASSPLKDDDETRKKVLVAQSDVTMLLPAHIGDYSDFYASREHATNVGTMLRGKDNALQPNWYQRCLSSGRRINNVDFHGRFLYFEGCICQSAIMVVRRASSCRARLSFDLTVRRLAATVSHRCLVHRRVSISNSKWCAFRCRFSLWTLRYSFNNLNLRFCCCGLVRCLGCVCWTWQ